MPDRAPKGRRRVSIGALLSVGVTLAGAVAMIAIIAPWLQRIWLRRGSEVMEEVAQAEARTILSIELTVTFDESQGANSTGRLTSTLVADGSDGGDLRLVASADALGFSGIRDAAGWPPDVPGLFDGGLDLYRADLTVRFSDGTRADTRVRSIAVTDVDGRYYLFAPIAGAGEPIPGAHRVLRAFDADNVGICALARHEVDELGRE